MNDKKDFCKKLTEREIVLFGTGDKTKDFFREFSGKLKISYCLSQGEESELLIDGSAVCPVQSIEDWYFAGKVFIIFCDEENAALEDYIGKKGCKYGEDYLTADLVRCLMSEKKIAVFYGVCTQRSICECLKLSRAMTDEYVLYYWLSYRTMTVKEHEMFLFMLEHCDLYIYNACITDKWKKHNDLLLGMLNRECRTISLPIVSSRIYHPQALKNRDKNNQYCVTSSKSYYAPFLSPDCNINEMLDEGRSTSEILEVISDENYYSEEWLVKNRAVQEKRIKFEEAFADIKIKDFLIREHGKKRLFFNEKHVSNVVLLEFARRLLSVIGFPDDLPEREILAMQLLNTTEVPLYPSVIKNMNLSAYAQPQYDIFTFDGRRKVGFEEYVSLYCDFCGNMKRYMEMGLFPK